MKGIIYQVTNMQNGKKYIGATTYTMKQRKLDHIERSNRYESSKFHNAVSTFGEKAFEWEQIDTANSTDELAQKEKYYILKYNTKEEGYNSDEGGGIKKSVFQYNIEDGSLINKFDCLEDAAITIGAIKQQISSTCLSVNKSFGGYYWSYIYKEPFEPEKDLRKKTVYQFSIDGQFLSKYVSVAEASRQMGLSKTCISRVCRGERNQAGGFLWKYE